MNDVTVCPICRQPRALSEMTHGDLIPDAIADVLQRRQPDWPRENVACATCIGEAKAARLSEALSAEIGLLSPLEQHVIDSVRDRGLASIQPAVAERASGRGERTADRVVATVGSWRFSAAILALLAIWIGANVLFRPFDPYPIIILAAISAALASIAALQGPIILMSQRRQLQRDRARAEHDYQVGLQAELEIRSLDEKIDHMLTLQRQLLLAQVEILDRLIAPTDQSR